VPLRDVARGVGKEVGRAEISGHHAEAAGERVAFADGLASGESGPSGALVLDEENCFGQGSAALVGGRRRLEVRVLPRPHRQSDRGELDARLVELRREPGHPTGPRAVRLTSRRARGALQRRRARAAADADEKDALRAARRPRQVQRLVAGTAEVAPLERAAQRAAERLVEGDERAGDGGALGQPDREKRRVLGDEVGAADGERERHGPEEGWSGGRRDRQARMPAMMPSAKADVPTSVAPGIWRARS
jgi:hypothetical protein